MAARFEIAALLIGALQPAMDQPQPFGGDAVGHRVEAGGTIGFEAMRQGVHAGGGGDVPGQADAQLGSAMTIRGIIFGWR